MKYIIATILSIVTIPTSQTFAHVKWFAEPVAPARPYELTDWPVLVWILVVILVIYIGIQLDKKLKTPDWFNRLSEKIAPNVLSLASIGFGISFIIFSYNKFVFAPNLPTESLLLLGIQSIAGIMILFGFYERIAGGMLITLFGLCVYKFGLIEMLDTLEMLGFACYVMIIGRPKWSIRDINFFTSLRHRLHPYALPILRVGTGLNLIVLGFSEKILTPALTSDFLTHYDWNFMQKIGFENFNNYWFAFSAGVTESLFGLFFVLGLVTRTTTLALAVFLVTTLVLLGPIELIGHLPHFSIAVVLIILGAGARFKINKNN